MHKLINALTTTSKRRSCRHKRRLIQCIIVALTAFSPTYVFAVRYILDNPKDMLIGQPGTTQVQAKDTLLDIARRYGLGYQEIKLSNPGIDTWYPREGQKINLPLQFILPNAPKTGIVLNIPEMRLYYYPPEKKNEIRTYPIGVGRAGWATPYLLTKIIEKKEMPEWHPPKSIREKYEEAGALLPETVAAGPNNPLGDYALRLAMPSYLIHGTNKPHGIGMRVSHGCIRLYPEDIALLFNAVSLGTPVNIINQPYKIGVRNNIIYLEAHPFLEEHANTYKNKLTPVISAILGVTQGQDYTIDWSAAFTAINEPQGVPVPIGLIFPTVTKTGQYTVNAPAPTI